MPLPQEPFPQEVSSTEARFAQFLRQREAGEAMGFEDFCARYPDEETALRMLHSVYMEGKSAAAAPSLGSKLEKFFGATVVEKSSLDSLVFAEEGGGQNSSEKVVTSRDRPRYEEKGEIARGGMGIVFRVLDHDLNRQLAMKVLQSSQTTARSPVPARATLEVSRGGPGDGATRPPWHCASARVGGGRLRPRLLHDAAREGEGAARDL